MPPAFVKEICTLLTADGHPEELEAFLSSMNDSPVKGLLLNPQKGPLHLLSDAGEPRSLVPVPWSRNGFFVPEDVRPTKSPAYAAGRFYSQEPSAMLPAAVLGAQPGELILDLCAAPGGKTAGIAADLGASGVLVSNEIDPDRARALVRNVESLGLANCVVTNASPEALALSLFGRFDRILVDAPCSGEGLFRRQHSAVQSWKRYGPKAAAALQREILESAWRMLKPGGLLVYSTCTFAREENEGQIEAFILAHEDAELVSCWERLRQRGLSGPLSEGIPKLFRGDISRLHGAGVSGPPREANAGPFTDGVLEPPRKGTTGLDLDPGELETRAPVSYMIRVWPHRTNGDGHFCACLVKRKSTSPLPVPTVDQPKVEIEGGCCPTCLSDLPDPGKRKAVSERCGRPSAMVQRRGGGGKRMSSRGARPSAPRREEIGVPDAIVPVPESQLREVADLLALFPEPVQKSLQEELDLEALLKTDVLAAGAGLGGPVLTIHNGHVNWQPLPLEGLLPDVRILKPGLYLGEITSRQGKDRFQPSHALLRALPAKAFRYPLRLEEGDPRVAAALRGETLVLTEEEQTGRPPDGSTVVICLGDDPLARGRIRGGVIKNQLPASWRTG